MTANKGTFQLQTGSSLLLFIHRDIRLLPVVDCSIRRKRPLHVAVESLVVVEDPPSRRNFEVVVII